MPNNNVYFGNLAVNGITGGAGAGSTVLDIQGTAGQLFSVVDGLTGSLMSVNDVSGLPILEVFSDDRVVMGTYGSPALTVSGSNVELDAKTKVESADQCPLEVKSSATGGGGIALMDSTTTNNLSVGIGASGNDLCLRSGGATAGNARLLSNGTLSLLGNPISNFTPAIPTGTTLTVDASNQDQFCGSVYGVTGAINITINDTVRDGFNLSVVQLDNNQCTIVAGGTLTLRNRQGQSKSAGQWATLSIIRLGSNLILAGDTN